MTNLLIYIIQVTGVFSLLYIVFRIVLSRLTFHATNRYLLLSLLPISILFPLLDGLFPSISQIMVDVPLYEGIVFTGIENFNIQEASIPNTTINYWAILTILYCLGVGLNFFKLILDIRKLVLVKRKSETYQQKGFKIIFTNISQIFSFFNWIFIPKGQKNNYDKLIIEHEKAHIKLKHSFDVLITELYIALFWYNPFVYFYRKSLKSVHEFQADNSVLKKKIKTSHYLQLLVQNLEVKNPNTIYSYFDFPILKRRIDMITKTKSTQFAKLHYLILVPVCALFLLAFANPTTKSLPVTKTAKTIEISDLLPSLFPIKTKSKADITSFFGKRKHPKSKKETIHGGIDIRAKTGTPVIATADGITSKASLEGDWGNLIVISHAEGYQTWYAHLSGFNSKENQSVKKGDIIGYVGNTGLSIAPHLHYEVKHNGQRVNPINYITE